MYKYFSLAVPKYTCFSRRLRQKTFTPMPLPTSRFSYFTVAGTNRGGAGHPRGPRACVTSRGTNDAVLRSGPAPQLRPRTMEQAASGGGSATFSRAYASSFSDFGQGVMEGLTDSLKNAWNLVSRDMWESKTYSELATTAMALSLFRPLDVPSGLAAAQAFDWLWGTHVAQRQLEILQAINQLVLDVPRWTCRQWGHAVGRIIGDVVLAKGGGAALKIGAGVAVSETVQLRSIATSLQKLGTLPAGAGRIAQARAVLPVYRRFTSVRLQIPFRNVSTLPNKSAFWSGLEGSSAEAKALANSSGRATLEMTKGGAWLETQTALFDPRLLRETPFWNNQMRPQWSRLSKRFASQARGEVEVFQGPRYDAVNSIWVTEEKGVLEASQRAGKVKNITIKPIPKK
ncbi:hypothetical protein [Hymenobacter sp. UYCo722]|uniref:hypothetical protein n=1 Tax=Hymenobacter sp. UYCo722 TaxID=3156335 RepID=UPI00339AABA2